MKYATLCALFALISIGIFVDTTPAEGAADLSQYQQIRFNNDNWYTIPHPKVLSFSVTVDGGASGVTEDGRLFRQYMVPNQYGIRVQRFEIEDHYHYIVEGEIIDSFAKFSALLASAYQVKYKV